MYNQPSNGRRKVRWTKQQQRQAVTEKKRRTPANLSSRKCVIIGNISKNDLVEGSFWSQFITITWINWSYNHQSTTISSTCITVREQQQHSGHSGRSTTVHLHVPCVFPLNTRLVYNSRIIWHYTFCILSIVYRREWKIESKSMQNENYMYAAVSAGLVLSLQCASTEKLHAVFLCNSIVIFPSMCYALGKHKLIGTTTTTKNMRWKTIAAVAHSAVDKIRARCAFLPSFHLNWLFGTSATFSASFGFPLFLSFAQLLARL